MIFDILILFFSKVVLTLLNHGWWKVNGIDHGMAKSKWNVLISPKPRSIANQIHAWREDALKPQTNIIVSVNQTGRDKSVMKKVSENN